MSELLRVENLKKYFKTPKGMLHAVDDISFPFKRGRRSVLWGNPDAANRRLAA